MRPSPRVQDRSSPEQGFRTFQGALARQEYGREFDSLTENLQRKLGLSDRGRWTDARILVLTNGSLLIKAVYHADIRESKRIGAERAELVLGLPLGKRGTVRMRRMNVFRLYLARKGQQEARPEVDRTLPELRILVGPAEDPRWFGLELGPALAGGILEMLDEEIVEGVEVSRVEFAREWFLDDFFVGEQTPSSVRADVRKSKKERRP